MRWTRRLAAGAGLAVAAAGIAVPLSLAGSPAAASSSQPSADRPARAAAADGHRHPGRAGHPALPRQLRVDLRGAWSAPDGKRVAALKAVLAKAVAGTYGPQVQRRAQRLQHRLDAMDPALRADVLRALDLPDAQRRAALHAVREKLRAGGYGKTARRDAGVLRQLHRRHLLR